MWISRRTGKQNFTVKSKAGILALLRTKSHFTLEYILWVLHRKHIHFPTTATMVQLVFGLILNLSSIRFKRIIPRLKSWISSAMDQHHNIVQRPISACSRTSWLSEASSIAPGITMKVVRGKEFRVELVPQWKEMRMHSVLTMQWYWQWQHTCKFAEVKNKRSNTKLFYVSDSNVREYEELLSGVSKLPTMHLKIIRFVEFWCQNMRQVQKVDTPIYELYQLCGIPLIALAMDAYHRYGLTIKAYFSGQRGNLYSCICIYVHILYEINFKM